MENRKTARVILKNGTIVDVTSDFHLFDKTGTLAFYNGNIRDDQTWEPVSIFTRDFVAVIIEDIPSTSITGPTKY